MEIAQKIKEKVEQHQLERQAKLEKQMPKPVESKAPEVQQPRKKSIQEKELVQ